MAALNSGMAAILRQTPRSIDLTRSESRIDWEPNRHECSTPLPEGDLDGDGIVNGTDTALVGPTYYSGTERKYQ